MGRLNSSYLNSLINLTKLTFGYAYNEPLVYTVGDTIGTYLDSLINLKELTFGNTFNQPINNMFNHIINLEILIFGNEFNQPLGNNTKSFLSNLIHLKELTFYEDFNQPIYYSNEIPIYILDNPDLIKLAFGGRFNQPLGDSNTNYLANSWILLDLFAVGTDRFCLGDRVEILALIELDVGHHERLEPRTEL
jgi:hypothetical protein